MAGNLKIGVLALQGAVEPHKEKLLALGAEPIEVRREAHLEGLSGIILPGGESSTMIHLLKLNKLWEPLKQFVHQKPSWGVCAGAILLSKHVTSPVQESLDRLSVTIERNAFGRQTESFISHVKPTTSWSGTEPVEGVFIRAPRFREVGKEVRVLFLWEAEPVMVEEGDCLASSFHPELSESNSLHEYFLRKCKPVQ